MISLIRLNYNTVKYECENEDEEIVLENSLTLQVEGSQHSELFKKQKWDGKNRFFNKDGTFSYGLVDVVKRACAEYKIEVNEYEADFKPFVPTLPFKAGLHEHQIKACQEFFENLFGIVVVPTRGGKTYLASETIRHFMHADDEEVCLFIVDTEDLYIQARREISTYLEEPVGGIRGDEFVLERVNVATVQTLNSIMDGLKNYEPAEDATAEQIKIARAKIRLRKKLLEEFILTVSYLIVDECHEFGTEKRIRLLNKFKNSDKRLFLSATPFKSQNVKSNYTLMRVSGREIYRIPIQELRDKGVLTQNKTILVYIDHNQDRNIRVSQQDKGAYLKFVEEVITHNFKRNSIAINMIEICRKIGLKVLVLFTIKSHAHWIQSITGDDFLHGSHSSKVREEVKNKFLKMKGGVLYASDIWKKGVTLPEAQVMLNAGGGLEQTGVEQKQGRVFGAIEGKGKSLIIDFIDDYKYFKEHSLSRIEAYERTSSNKEDLIVLDIADKEFYHDFWSIVTDWFEN